MSERATRSVMVPDVTEDDVRAIELAMTSADVRVLAIVAGLLMPLESDRARGRVLHWAADRLAEQTERDRHEQDTTKASRRLVRWHAPHCACSVCRVVEGAMFTPSEDVSTLFSESEVTEHYRTPDPHASREGAMEPAQATSASAAQKSSSGVGDTVRSE
jgi:hypothetical protein